MNVLAYRSEISELMSVKSKHGAGGEYAPDWQPRVSNISLSAPCDPHHGALPCSPFPCLTERGTAPSSAPSPYDRTAPRTCTSRMARRAQARRTQREGRRQASSLCSTCSCPSPAHRGPETPARMGSVEAYVSALHSLSPPRLTSYPSFCFWRIANPLITPAPVVEPAPEQRPESPARQAGLFGTRPVFPILCKPPLTTLTLFSDNQDHPHRRPSDPSHSLLIEMCPEGSHFDLPTDRCSMLISRTIHTCL
jgi:hypothetical protein